MIRFILKRTHQENISGARWEEHETLDVNVPELEAALQRGGRGPDGCDVTNFVGLEIR